MSLRPVRVAVIGKGLWGKNIINTLKTLPECIVAYSAELDYRHLLKRNDIDAVIVATPAATHAAVALPFIKKGTPVFIEKPLTTTLADAERLATTSIKNKTLIFVGHLHLYSPAYLALKRAAKKIGNIRFIVGEGASNGPFRDDVSVMWDWAPHDLAMILDLAGAKPTSVQAWGVSLVQPKTRFHDITYLKLNFPSGLVAFVYSSRLSPKKKRSIGVIGTKNSVVYDDTAENKVMLVKGIGTNIVGTSVKKNSPAVSYSAYSADLPLTEEMRAFLAMVKTKKKPKTDVQSGIEVITILEAAEQSIAANGKIISIKRTDA